MSGHWRRFTGLTWTLAAVCVLTLAGALVLALVVADRRSEVEEKGQVRVTTVGDVDAGEDFKEVVAAAQRFTVTWNTIDPDDAPAYVRSVRPLVTEGFFEKAFQGKEAAAAKLIREGGVTSDGKVLTDADGVPLVGVGTIDPNSATVMVVADSLRRVNGQRALRHWRWQLELVKEGDAWLVDDLIQV